MRFSDLNFNVGWYRRAILAEHDMVLFSASHVGSPRFRRGVAVFKNFCQCWLKWLCEATIFWSAVMAVDASCILVLLQCRDREWYGDKDGNEAWAREASQRCIDQGFGVLRVPTQNWADVKRKHPEWFSPVFDENQCKQQVICTINFIHFLCPMLQKVHSVLQSCDDDDSVSHAEQYDSLSICLKGSGELVLIFTLCARLRQILLPI